ncbi:MAG: hypothetical protein A4E66_00590 [Syntrophus sp. PtaB.Bin001]|jgi:iron uptake system EfeUOB component EfeO/EfeM|nr:MAG: hypothetical protein A4E66_00590 [Syntrophus sp. PtaB.Bin001]
MQYYWLKISEEDEGETQRHHYIVSAEDINEARKIAREFIRNFCEDDENPEPIKDGFSFYNNAVQVRLTDVKETTKEEFTQFIFKLHSITWR